MRVFTLLFVATVASTSVCSRQPEIPQGSYHRGGYMVLDRSGKVLKSDGDVDYALPPTIRILPGNVYEIDARLARVRGSYRVERDSVFFDDRAVGGQTVVSLFGILSGDTLQLRAPALLIVLGGEPGMDLLIDFVKRSR